MCVFIICMRVFDLMLTMSVNISINKLLLCNNRTSHLTTRNTLLT